MGARARQQLADGDAQGHCCCAPAAFLLQDNASPCGSPPQGADIWPNWDNKPNCILNNLYQTNLAAPWHFVGKGFNDPDMLQPPNTLKTVLKPGLTPDESCGPAFH